MLTHGSIDVPQEAISHNALDDCIRQAKEVSYFIANLQHDGRNMGYRNVKDEELLEHVGSMDNFVSSTA